MDWSGVDYCNVFISCLDSHSDGTHSLQSIHCWDTDAMLHFSKSDEDTNSSTSFWANVHFWLNYSFNKTYCTSKEACQWRSKKPEAERLKPIRDESPETLHCSCYCQWSQVAVRSNRAPRRGLYKVEISLVLLQLAHISLSLCWAI